MKFQSSRCCAEALSSKTAPDKSICNLIAGFTEVTHSTQSGTARGTVKIKSIGSRVAFVAAELNDEAG
ncbi:hypothetical protein K1W69_00220 [Hoeflea sp. WL0058]|uniref:Uncharacterized protein n=1 Tax=Flavimaribacter sediminis TaxID=2865987 RepID=A0AAE2ZJQ2_9HYPH|nr:hypothetical protein [Flavimaribacter sediminis]MBW8635593.1 hypothetical protein [Flavimaribacter sediminis]